MNCDITEASCVLPNSKLSQSCIFLFPSLCVDKDMIRWAIYGIVTFWSNTCNQGFLPKLESKFGTGNLDTMLKISLNQVLIAKKYISLPD